MTTLSLKMWQKICLTVLSQSLLFARVGFPQNNLLWRIKRDNLETKNVVKNRKNIECPLDELPLNEAGNIIRMLIYNLGANNCHGQKNNDVFKDIFNDLVL